MVDGMQTGERDARYKNIMHYQKMGTVICGRKGTLRMTIIQKGEPMSDLISRQAAIEARCNR